MTLSRPRHSIDIKVGGDRIDEEDGASLEKHQVLRQKNFARPLDDERRKWSSYADNKKALMKPVLPERNTLLYNQRNRKLRDLQDAKYALEHNVDNLSVDDLAEMRDKVNRSWDKKPPAT